jgi:geranylgeranyl diphosphate synthase type I
MRLKTAMYSFVRPMQFGVSMVKNEKGKMKNMMVFCEKFGLPLGMAFQIQDDLFDLTVSSKKLGKSSFNDVKEGQKTVFTQYASRNAKNRALLNRMKGKKLMAADRARLKKMFEESGAIEHGIEMMEAYFEEAERGLDRLPSAKSMPFMELLNFLRSRTM